MTARSILRSWAHALGGDVVGGQVLAPGPGHSPKDRSLSVTISANSPDGFVVHSHAGDYWRDCRDHVRSLLGISRSCDPTPRKIEPRANDNGERALCIWDEAADPRGTVVENYLRRRGLDLPVEAASEAIRFHGNCPFGGARTPAMVCLVRNIITNAPQAIHRTALDRDGDKMSLGPIAGGAVKLTPDEDVTTCLGVAEGIETTLTLPLAAEFGSSPIWSLISAGGIAKLHVLPGVECLWISVDNDAAGSTAAQECAARWRRAGNEVYLVTPDARGFDLNDLAKDLRHA